jgi:hypothetical protein
LPSLSEIAEGPESSGFRPAHHAHST